MVFCLIQGRKHEGQYNEHILTDQTENVLIVPKIQSTFCHLQIYAQQFSPRCFLTRLSQCVMISLSSIHNKHNNLLLFALVRYNFKQVFN